MPIVSCDLFALSFQVMDAVGFDSGVNIRKGWLVEMTLLAFGVE